MGSGYHRNFGAADQVRTGPKSLEGSCATTTPQPPIFGAMQSLPLPQGYSSFILKIKLAVAEG